MGTGNAIIVGMGVLAVGTGVVGGILNSVGKSTEAQWLDLASKSLLGSTAIGCFAQFIGNIKKIMG
jgi:hypothetical protein